MLETVKTAKTLPLGNAYEFLHSTGFSAVISKHGHRPSIRWEAGVLFLNPGSAGPRRFKLLTTVALLQINGEDVEAESMDLEV